MIIYAMSICLSENKINYYIYGDDVFKFKTKALITMDSREDTPLCYSIDYSDVGFVEL
jgi:hypothetical protein